MQAVSVCWLVDAPLLLQMGQQLFEHRKHLPYRAGTVSDLSLEMQHYLHI
jgi:hypothetical protein